MAFLLHPRLAADTLPLGRLPLCAVLLMDDRTVPWLILVPEREGASEIHDLSPADRSSLMEEAALVSSVLKGLFGADKVNLGALGNLVPQLHLHVVARFSGDRAWPGPVWGAPGGVPYPAGEREPMVAKVRGAFMGAEGFSPFPQGVPSGERSLP